MLEAQHVGKKNTVVGLNVSRSFNCAGVITLNFTILFARALKCRETSSLFLISNFSRVLNIVYALFWGIFPASDCSLPTFRNPLSVPS